MLIPATTHEVYQLEANLCYAFVDPTRILILYALNKRPHSVTELTQHLQTNQPKVSRHLKVLRDLGMVRITRQGTTVIYELADYRLIEVLDILRGVLRDSVTDKASLLTELQIE
jgi:ArsR family transcriptional regulator